MRGFSRNKKTAEPKTKKSKFLLVVVACVMLSFSASFIRPAAAGWSDAAIIAAIVGFKTIVVTLMNSVLGGFDSLNQHMTDLAKLQTAAVTDVQVGVQQKQTAVDTAKADAEIALQKGTATDTTKEWCIKYQALYALQLAMRWHAILYDTLLKNPYSFMGIKPTCFGVNAGHGTTSGSPNCQGAQQGMLERKKIACKIGTERKDDLSSTDACSGTNAGLKDANKELVGASENPEIIFKTTMYLAPGGTPDDSVDPPLQRMFMAAMLYCYTINGYSPQQPIKAELNTPAGFVMRQNLATWESISKVPMQACLDEVAYHAQPPCGLTGSGDFAALCTQMQTNCENAKRYNKKASTNSGTKEVDLSAYPGCVAGTGALSPYEANKLQAEMCIDPRSSFNVVAAPKAKQTAALDVVDKCADVYRTFLDREAARKNQVRSIIAGHKP